jgi:antitoxin (DNA-binding transcriptional repressor) of toxin-antitoxin stability system
MTEIGAYDAKTHLPALLERVRLGERFIITKHGRPVAELRALAGHDTEQARRAVAEMRKLRKELAARGVRLRKILEEGESLRDLAHSGHRY